MSRLRRWHWWRRVEVSPQAVLWPPADLRLLVAEGTRAAEKYQALARTLETLSSPARLEILHELRTPRELNELRITSAAPREGLSESRPLARQTVSHHLDHLIEAGLVRRLGEDARARGALYVLNHPRLFAAVDEMRGLARLTPTLIDAGSDATLAHSDASARRLPPPPRLLVAYGRDNGVAHGLPTVPGDSSRIGRSSPCEIVLDYDPYVSTTHCRIDRESEGHTIIDLDTRNGTFVNWSRLTRGGSHRLRSGDLVAIGRSVLVYQDFR